MDMSSIFSPAAAWAPEYPILLIAALLISALGFFRTVFFVSIGYGFSIAIQAILLIFLHRGHLGPAVFIQLTLLSVYGLRLGSYLSYREGKSAYKTQAEDVADRGSVISTGRKFAIWIGVAILYVMMVSPALYRVRAVIDGRPTIQGLAWAGVAVMCLGLGLEALSDLQKSRYKTANPDRYCDTGLYRMVRCPNYLGEILFWTGSLVAGAASLKGVIPWIIALIAWLCITLIMLGSTKRLESKQDERYGHREDFREYASTTPVLFPLIPLYSLKNLKVYLE